MRTAPAGEYSVPCRTIDGGLRRDGSAPRVADHRAPFRRQRGWTALAFRRYLRLAKIFDEGLIHHGVTADICARDNNSASQRFAGALFAAYPDVDGIACRVRRNNG
jgi:hypothetical protein